MGVDGMLAFVPPFSGFICLMGFQECASAGKGLDLYMQWKWEWEFTGQTSSFFFCLLGFYITSQSRDWMELKQHIYWYHFLGIETSENVWPLRWWSPPLTFIFVSGLKPLSSGHLTSQFFWDWPMKQWMMDMGMSKNGVYTSKSRSEWRTSW